jgi:D-alanine-D-alanine ligase-like ATP-grasp enzyme/acylphosphatase
MTEQYNNNWLSHLKDSVPKEAYGYPVGMYSIALEGWRRGLSLKFINNNRPRTVIKYVLSDGDKSHSYTAALGDGVTNEAKKICNNKHLTKEYLSKANVSIPIGEFFSADKNDDEIIEFAKKLGFPVVIKPISGYGGRGVIANIKDLKSLKEALQYVRSDLKYKDVIVEQYYTGDDYRLYVIDGKVEGVINRIPANVVGDGSRTISELLEEKNKLKRINPALKGSPIKKDKELTTLLNSYGYTIDSIPNKGEMVFLKTKSNISAGGEPVDATDKVTEKVKTNAIKALQAIPGLPHGGVDVLWDPKKDSVAVLEVNYIPSIRTHLFPMIGNARDIPKAIVDYYFPQTKQNIEEPLYYFDIGDIYKGFQNNTLQSVSIPEYPAGAQTYQYFKINNISRVHVKKRRIQKLAKSLHLNGFVQVSGRKSLNVLISGTNDKLQKFISKSKLKLDELEKSEWKKPIKIGFEIIDEKSKNSTIKQRELDRLKKERDFYKDKYREIKNLKTPLYRKLINKIKR